MRSRFGMSSREKAESRIHAAQVNGGAAAVQAKGGDRYSVTGRAGDRYTVLALSLERMVCDCKAGHYGNPCWHAAAVYLRKVAESAVAA